MTKWCSSPKRIAQTAATFMWIALSLFLASPASAGTATYTYDDLNRLIHEVYNNGTVISYSYDSAGNRLSREVLGSTGAITLITPNGGEHWKPGSTETIYWTYKGTAGTTVKIELFKGGALNSTIVTGTSIGSGGTGSFAWAIPSAQTSGSDYTVKISSTSDGTVTDSSSSAFTIEDPSAFSIATPTGGAKWERGVSQTIAWTYTGDPGSAVRLDLLKGGVVQSCIAQSAPIGSNGSGSFSWAIPSDQPPGSDYQLTIATSAGEHASISSTFTILGGMTVSSPASGTRWQAGMLQTISWSYTGDPGPMVKIELLKGGVVDSIIAAGAPIGSSGYSSYGSGGYGSYDWFIPVEQAAGSDYAIRVTSTSNSLIAGTSKNSFTIVPTSITLTSPNGGNAWAAGTLQTISWSYKGDPGSMVRIDLLKGGVVNTTIAADTPIGSSGSGSYSWLIPVEQVAGADYALRVTSTSNSAYTDVSDSSFTIAATAITVNSPSNGKSWAAGSLQTISWSYTGDPGPAVKIELLKGGVPNTTIAASTPIGSSGWGSYYWLVPVEQAAGTDYSVRITSTGESAYSGVSSGSFSLVAPSITVSSPSGGNSWEMGTTQTISWNYVGNPGSMVKIELLKSGVLNATITDSTPIGSSGSGSYHWLIPAGQAAGTDYTMRISSISNGDYGDTSNSNFTIKVPNAIVVTSPGGGESWPAGTAKTISWTYSGSAGSTVTLELLKGGSVNSTIATGVSIGSDGSGSYSWTVPNSQTSGTDYRIRVRSSQVSGSSSNFFSITNSSVITLASPIGGETLQAGSSQTIRWTCAGNPGSSVTLELLKGGSLNTTIATGISVGAGGGGSYAWTIPAAQTNGSDYQIRITCGSYSDTSNANFSIVPTLISVSSPSGGNSWDAGTLQTISWSYTGNPGSAVKIDLLKGGVLNATIAAGTPIGRSGSGSYKWLIPEGQAAGTDYSVRVASSSNSEYAGTSKNTFTIVPTGIKLGSPNGGNSWEAGTLQSINWSYDGDPGVMVKIELLKGGVLNSVIAESTPTGTNGSGSYKWLIPVGQAAGTDYAVRITSASNSAYTDVSDSSFTIVPTSITVSSPNGGNSWEAGTRQKITWNYDGDPGPMVKIELLKGGVVSSTIAASTPIGSYGSGSYSWQIPAEQVGGADYAIRVTSTSNSAWTDVSNNSFTIVSTGIKLGFPNGGNSWETGSTQKIYWNYDGNPGSFAKIELLKSGAVHSIIAAGTPTGSDGYGSYYWQLPAEQAGGTDYTIRVTSTSNSAYTDVSDSSFTIVPAGITVSSPNGGDSRRAGTVQTISWSYKGNPGSSVTIELLKGGVLNTTIAAATAIGTGGSGAYTWRIPESQAAGTDYTIRITSTSSNAFSDVSDSSFTIAAPGISVLTPNGGERWQAGTTQNISWTYDANAGTLAKIELLKGGLSVSTIASSTSIGSDGAGSYQWAIPVGQAGAADYTIRVTSKSNGSNTDVSNNQFAILPALETGSFTGTITPQDAVAAGAQWKLDSGSWKESGQTLSAVAIGSHTVTFKNISGWATPAAQTITISKGQTATATGTYTQEFGNLMVTITPQPAVAAGAQWKLDAGDWQTSGATLQSVPGGSHTVTFKDITGWITPSPQTVSIVGGQLTSISGSYSEQPPGGALTVTITPAAAVSAGAQWKVDTGAWQASGATVAGLTEGLHTVTFKDLINWTTPAAQSVTITSGQTAAASGAYQSQIGSLTVAISPQAAIDGGAQWRVDGGSWQASGATLGNLTITQTHTLIFKDVHGWTTPASQVLNVPAEGLSVTGTYVEQSSLYSISGTVTSAGAALSGVTVSLSEAATKSTTTDSNGNYTFSGLANGSYTITPAKTDYIFTPANLSVTVNNGDLVGLEFTAITKPGAPTGVLATAGNGEATVTFTPPASNGGSAITSYTVTSNPGNTPATGSASPITVIGLTNGTTYTFTVKATNAAGAGPGSTSSNEVTPVGSGYSISGKITCAGTSVSGVTVSLTGAATKSTTTDSNGHYSFLGLSNGSHTITPSKTEYTFTPPSLSVTIKGGNIAGKNFKAKTKPGAPTGVTAKAGNASATVKFTAPASNGGSAITSYTVMSTSGGFKQTGRASPIKVTGLTNGSSYAFTVTATNKIGSGEGSEASSPVTPAAKPGAPRDVTAVAGDARATIAFAPPASDGGSAITQYTVTSYPGGIQQAGSTSPITVTGLTNGKTYRFTVKATNARGTGPESDKSDPVTPSEDGTVPGVPTNVSATPGVASATVTFTPPASNGGSAITSYTVASSPDGIIVKSTKSPITVTKLTNGTIYTFTVTATNKTGTGAPSLQSNPVKPAKKPGKPTGVAATAGDASATVSFTAPASDGGSPITSFKVISSPGSRTATGTGSPITVPKLTNGTTYTFTVRASNAIGAGPKSAQSNPVKPSTVPGKPTGVKATAGNSLAKVSFTAPTSTGGSPITSYTVTSNPGNFTSNGKASPITVKGLTNGKAYTFTVRASNALGMGPASSPSKAVTPAPARQLAPGLTPSSPAEAE